MDFFLILATIIFAVVAFWLVRLGTLELIVLSVYTSLTSQDVKAWKPMVAYHGSGPPPISSDEMAEYEVEHETEMLQRSLRKQKKDKEPHETDEILEYVGGIALPKRVYINNSHNVFLKLKPMSRLSSKDGKAINIQDNKTGKAIVLQIKETNSIEQFLVVELIAAGFTVAGEKQQRQLLASEALTYRWNCYFPNSGNHALALTLKVVSPSGAVEIGVIEHSIKCAQLDHLTQRQIWMMATSAGIISGVLGLAEILHRLGIW